MKAFFSEILPLLVDPENGQALRLEGDNLVSDTNSYSIWNDIPRFVRTDDYVDSFSFEWNTHNRTQLDSFRGGDSSEQQFRQKTGFTPEEVRGKLVLDAGVGAGRYSDIVSKWGGQTIGVDLSFAVESAQKNFEERENVLIMQADIGKLPFKVESFDFIFSIGVLHHTPDTRSYFKTLIPLLKPGGEISIWVYPDEKDYVTRKQWIPFTSRIPDKWYYQWCRWFVPWAQDNSESSWKRVINNMFPYSRQGLGMENDILDTFDGYSPRYHGVHSIEEVKTWFEEAGLENVHCPSDWKTCMRGRKPLEHSADS